MNPLSRALMTLILAAAVAGGSVLASRTEALASPSCGDTTPVVLFPPTRQFVNFNVATLTETDPLFTQITGITQDEPVNVPTVDGFDAVILSPTDFEVRAERLGNGNGRVYVVTYTVSDLSGNQISCQLPIQVPVSPNRTAINDGQNHNSLPG
jgi:hypothetical protein